MLLSYLSKAKGLVMKKTIEDAEKYFENDDDKELLKNIKEFNTFDLYSKNDDFKLTKEIKNYYKYLLYLFFPNYLNW